MTPWKRRTMRPPTAAGVALLVLSSLLGCGGQPGGDADVDAGAGEAPDTSSWPQFRGNRAQTGVAEGRLADDLELRWVHDLGADIESTAAIVDGTVFVGAYDGVLYALDLETGAERWRYGIGSEAAIKSSPSVLDGVVFFGDENGTFHAVDASSGERLWTFDTGAEIISSATFAGDRVLFGSYDDTFYCLAREDGSPVWQVETEGYVHGSPAIVDGMTTVSGCDGYLWLVDLDDGSVAGRIDLGGQAGSSPAVVNGRAYVGTFENHVVGVDVATRQVLWTYEHPERRFPFYGSAAVTEDLVIIGGRDKLVHALDPRTGEARWEWNSGARIDSSPVVVGRRVFLGTNSGVLVALDVATGEPVWQFETGSAIVASPSVAQGKLVIGNLDGVLYCFE